MAAKYRHHVAAAALPEANNTVRAVNLRIGKHVTSCYQCSHAGGNTAKLCDKGWKLAKDRTAALTAVRRIKAAIDRRGDQDTLW